MSSKYLVLSQVFSIANAFAAPVWFQFYTDTGCRQNALDTIMLTIDEDYISEACVPIRYDEWHRAGGLAILNPNPCVVGVYGDDSCKGELIAYTMHFDEEPSCFNLTGLGSYWSGLYYTSASCIAPTQSTSQTTTLTNDRAIYVLVGP